MSTFGCPERLHSDQGGQFEAQVFQEMCKLLHIRKSRTTPYNPQGNGLTERTNRTLGQCLKSYSHDHPEEWDETLPLVLLSYRSAVHSSTGFAPAKMLLGQDLRLPADIVFDLPSSGIPMHPSAFVNDLDCRLRKIHRVARAKNDVQHRLQKEHYDQHCSGVPFAVGDLVWLRDTVIMPGVSRKFHWPWKGPYSVIKRVSDTVYDVQLVANSAAVKRVHFNRLKRCHSVHSQPSEAHEFPSVAEPSLPAESGEATFDPWPDDTFPAASQDNQPPAAANMPHPVPTLPLVPPPPPQPPPAPGPRDHLRRSSRLPVPLASDYVIPPPNRR